MLQSCFVKPKSKVVSPLWSAFILEGRPEVVAAVRGLSNVCRILTAPPRRRAACHSRSGLSREQDPTDASSHHGREAAAAARSGARGADLRASIRRYDVVKTRSLLRALLHLFILNSYCYCYLLSLPLLFGCPLVPHRLVTLHKPAAGLVSRCV